MNVSWLVDRFRRHDARQPKGGTGSPAAHATHRQTGGAIGPAAWRAWRETTLGAISDRLEQRLIVELVGDIADTRLLDAGCGDGVLVSQLSRRGAHAVGIDADRRMLIAAQSKKTGSKSRRAFVEGRLEDLPFPDGVFDVVIAVTVLCFMPDPSVALREAVRVLRPGGRLVIGELGRWNLWAARRRVRGWLGWPTWKAARFRTAGELRELLQRVGVAVTAVRGAVYYPPVGWIARILAPADRWLGRVTTTGAAFIAIVGTKAGHHARMENSADSDGRCGGLA